jgi:selenium metabolism protein YedF
MDMKVDALGDACPLPVVKAKQALNEMGIGTLEVLVDNQTAVHNLENLAKDHHCTSTVDTPKDGVFAVHIVQTETPKQQDATAPATQNPVVVISSATMGSGDDELGTTLMKGFIFALTQQDQLPKTVLFYNGGVRLTCEGSSSLDDLRALSEAGVDILSCGTCLKHYGLTDQLAVGDVTNMYVIAEKQLQASVVVRP